MFENNPLSSFYKRIYLNKYFYSNCIYCNFKKDLNINFKEIFFVYNDEKYVHLGDFLFIIPLLKYFNKRFKCKLILNKDHKLLLKKISPDLVQLTKSKIKLKKKSLIITNPYMLNKFEKEFVLGLGLPSSKIYIPYPKYLITQICKFIGIKFNIKEYNNIIKNMRLNAKMKNKSMCKEKKIFIFAPFIGSGKFRDILKFKQKKLIETKIKYENQGYSCVLIGSKYDKIRHKFKYDLRGQSLLTVMNIINSKNVKFGVGFDNFWMHYFDLINKKYFVLFRGRFFKKNKQMHYKSINLSFSKHPTRKFYIN